MSKQNTSGEPISLNCVESKDEQEYIGEKIPSVQMSVDLSSKQHVANKRKVCSINKPLLPLKASLFLYFGGISSFISFFSVFLKQKGISATQLAIFYTLTPFVQFVYQLLFAILADKTGKHKVILLLNLAACVLFSNIMLALPDQNTSSDNKNASSSSENLNLTLCTPFNLMSTICTSTADVLNSSVLNFNDSESAEASFTVPMPEVSMTIIIVAGVFSIAASSSIATVYRCFDFTAMNMATKFNSDYGKQMFWCLCGQVIFPPFAGYVVHLASPVQDHKNCSPAFFILDACALLIVISVWKMQVRSSKSLDNVLTKILEFLKNIDHVVFYAILTVSGTCWNFTEIFSTYHLDDLKATALNLGLKTSVSNIVGLPVVLFSDWFLSKIGAKKAFLLALLGHSVQSACYSYLVNPWWSLLIETLSIFTYHLMWVGVVTHANHLAPKGLVAVVISSAGAFHFTLGKGFGSSVGGLIMEKYGGQFAFKIMSSLSGTAAVLYAAFLLYSRFCRTK